jgi:putative addiction module antidote
MVITSVLTKEVLKEVLMVLKVRKFGNSLGVLLPAPAAEMLHVGSGDKLFLTETQEGFRLSAFDPDFAETMGVAEGFMGRYRNALHDLAK